MPNDAKLGLVVGVGLVVTVAVLFFRADPESGAPAGPAQAAALKSTSAILPGASRGVSRSVPAIPTTRTSGQRHTVREGDTLFTLAAQYYGDREKASEISRVNADVVKDGEPLTPGTVLTIPELPAADEASKNESSSTERPVSNP